MPDDSLIPPHGGYRKLLSFQVAQLCYDVTVRFCDLYIEKRSHTHDQMVQAARSGVQNIAEGSEVSATSKKMELKLTQVARASLEELLLDYEDFLRHRRKPLRAADDLRRKVLVAKRCTTADEVAAWVKEQHSAQRRNAHNGTRAADPLPIEPLPSTPAPRTTFMPRSQPTPRMFSLEWLRHF